MQNFKRYKIDLVKIDKIKPYERNAKIHNSEQLQQIKNSILEFGFTNPLIIDSDFNLIAGHGRLEALKMLNRVEFKDKPIKEINAVIIDGLSETQKTALIIADNKIAENAIWDDELLKSELSVLQETDFSLDLLGFNGDELDKLFNDDFNLNLDENLRDNPYTQKIVTPIYEPKGIMPNIKELCDTSEYFKRLREIEKAELPNDIKEFLILTASRFLKFDFAKIAEFYAHQSKPIKEIFENLLLVFIDYDKALEQGYVKLTSEIEQIAKELDYE